MQDVWADMATSPRFKMNILFISFLCVSSPNARDMENEVEEGGRWVNKMEGRKVEYKGKGAEDECIENG